MRCACGRRPDCGVTDPVSSAVASEADGGLVHFVEPVFSGFAAVKGVSGWSGWHTRTTSAAHSKTNSSRSRWPRPWCSCETWQRGAAFADQSLRRPRGLSGSTGSPTPQVGGSPSPALRGPATPRPDLGLGEVVDAKRRRILGKGRYFAAEVRVETARTL